MVGVVGDPMVAEPCRHMQDHFARKVGQGATREQAGGVNMDEVVEAFAPYLENKELKERVPSINLNKELQTLPSGTLVRYRGMVRDMLNPEYYMGAYKLETGEWRTTKYDEFSDHGLCDAVDNVMCERKPYFCAAVPGESEWLKQTEKSFQSGQFSSNGSDRTRSQKRERDGQEGAETHSQQQEASDANSEERGKRMEMDCDASEDAVPEPQASAQPGSATSASFVDEVNGGENPCLVKVYENSRLPDLRLNDVIEVLGVLSSDPRLTVFNGGSHDVGEEVTEEEMACNPPASKVPRLHVIVGRKIKCYERVVSHLNAANPSLPQKFSEGLRDKLIAMLSHVLGGDTLAASYVLLHLMSNTHRDGTGMGSEQLVGKHTLNIYNCSESSGVANKLQQLLASLVAQTMVLPMSLEKLNRSPMWPRKDYTTNRLIGGPLLLADQTHLILDETLLAPGQLQAVGVRNYQCLKTLVSAQSIEADFNFYKLPVNCNVPVVVCSQTKSVLPCDTIVKLRPSSESLPPSPMLSEAELTELRLYLCSLQAVEFSIPSEVSDHLQQQFVQERQKNPTNTNAEMFHRMLTLARLMSQSFGEAELSVSRWQELCQMEELLNQRQTS